NAGGALRRIDRAAPQPRKRAVAAPEAELQFRAADFDAEKHEGHYSVWRCGATSHNSNSARDSGVCPRLEFSRIHHVPPTGVAPMKRLLLALIVATVGFTAFTKAGEEGW